jgi:hypothetical protein
MFQEILLQFAPVPLCTVIVIDLVMVADVESCAFTTKE